MPLRGERTEVTQTLVDDLSKHLFANLPVTMVFSVTDAAGQEGVSAPYAVTLHGRRFFDPLAAALIEMRRDLMWNRINAPRAVEILKALTNRPEGFIRHDRAFLHLRVLMRELELKQASLSTEDRDAVCRSARRRTVVLAQCAGCRLGALVGAARTCRTRRSAQAPLVRRGNLERAGAARRLLGNFRLPAAPQGARGARHAGPRVHDDFDRGSHPRRRRPPALADDRETVASGREELTTTLVAAAKCLSPRRVAAAALRKLWRRELCRCCPGRLAQG